MDPTPNQKKQPRKRALPLALANNVLVTALQKSDALEDLPIYALVRDMVNSILSFIWTMEMATDAKVLFPSTVPPLLNQLSRSSTSVSANLAEGEGRTRTTGHYRQFILISRGSFVESIDHLRSFSTLIGFDKDCRVFGPDLGEECDRLVDLSMEVLKEFDLFIETTLGSNLKFPSLFPNEKTSKPSTKTERPPTMTFSREPQVESMGPDVKNETKRPDVLSEDVEVLDETKVSPKKLKVPPVEVPTPSDQQKKEDLMDHWIFQDDSISKRTRLALTSQPL